MRKSNIKQILRQSSGTHSSEISQLDDQDPLFQRYEKNLYASHKVPKVKIHQAKYWQENNKMSREYVDYVDEDKYIDEKDMGPFRNMPLKVELSFKSKNQLKREVWDNARAKGWLT